MAMVPSPQTNDSLRAANLIHCKCSMGHGDTALLHSPRQIVVRSLDVISRDNALLGSDTDAASHLFLRHWERVGLHLPSTEGNHQTVELVHAAGQLLSLLPGSPHAP